MQEEKKKEIKTNIECLVADYDILTNEDIGFRINSIRAKWFRNVIPPGKLKVMMSEMGKKGGRGTWKNTTLKNLADNTLKN